MTIFSQVLLALLCVLAILLLFRQPHKFNDTSKIATRIIIVCCLFIMANSIISLLTNANSEQGLVLVTMANNLQTYLAIPLLCSIFVCIGLDKHFSQAAWGRWSLVLLASFEICRRAQITEIYTQALAIGACVLITYSLFNNKTAGIIINPLLKLTAITSLISAMLIFSSASLITQQGNVSLFNILLGTAISLLCFIYGKVLGAKSAS